MSISYSQELEFLKGQLDADMAENDALDVEEWIYEAVDSVLVYQSDVLRWAGDIPNDCYFYTSEAADVSKGPLAILTANLAELFVAELVDYAEEKDYL